MVFSCGDLLRTRTTVHQYVIWQTCKKEFILLPTMSHHRCFVTHRSRLNTCWIFPVPLMEVMLKFMERKVKSQFSLFVAIGFIYRFVLVQKLQLILLLYLQAEYCVGLLLDTHLRIIFNIVQLVSLLFSERCTGSENSKKLVWCNICNCFISAF